jgi:beta-lactamase superfamily II metal-dependent hydrolase
MLSSRRRIALIVLAGLIVANACIAYSILSTRSHVLRVSFLDVGAGSAVFVEGPTGVKVLIDGGPDASILRALGAELSPFARTLDAVIETHPGPDAVGGLVDVFKDYRVRSFYSPGTSQTSAAEDALSEALAQEPDTKSAALTRGDRLTLGGGAYIDVLYPDRDVSGVDANIASLVLRIVYGQTSFLITGSAPSGVQNYLVQLDGPNLKSDALLDTNKSKSATTSPAFFASVAPEYVATSTMHFLSDGAALTISRY